MTNEKLAACDEKADTAISAMITAMIGAAVVPVAVNWALVAAALGGGCVAIGHAYGVTIDKEEGWTLCKQFFLGAGMTFLALNVGSKLFAGILQLTGVGYVAGAALDAVISAATAYAVGGCAKAYFRKMVQGQKLSESEAREIFRNRFKSYKETHKNDGKKG